MSLLNELMSEHGSELTGALTSQLGLSDGQANDAIGAVAPLVVNGLKSQQDAGGANAVTGLLSSLGGSEDLLGNLGNLSGLLTGGGGGGGGASNILGSLLGGASQGNAAESALTNKLGIDAGKAGAIVSILVPVIMGFLSKQGRKDPNTPDTQSGITSILDRDGDGNALDDIAGMVLQSQMGGRRGGGGLLGSIVGGLLGGRR